MKNDPVGPLPSASAGPNQPWRMESLDVTHINSMIELRPVNGTSAAIQDALNRAEAERLNTQERMKKLEQARGGLLLTAKTDEINANEQRIGDCKTKLQQIDALTEALQEPLRNAQQSEKVDALRAQWSELDYESKAQAFATWWQTEYQRHAMAIAGGLKLEAEALECAGRARHVRDALIAAGVDMPPLVSPSALAVGPITARSLGQMVKLPGIGGAPAVQVKTETIYHRKDVQKLDPNSTVRDRMGNRVGTHYVEEMVPEIVSRAVREDVAIWWLRD